ncbi:hypothetical protein AVEN_264016-1, partial [Araneus ventricosus]
MQAIRTSNLIHNVHMYYVSLSAIRTLFSSEQFLSWKSP